MRFSQLILSCNVIYCVCQVDQNSLWPLAVFLFFRDTSTSILLLTGTRGLTILHRIDSPLSAMADTEEHNENLAIVRRCPHTFRHTH